MRPFLVVTAVFAGLVCACPPAREQPDPPVVDDGDCGSDRDCGGGFGCDKTNDGDDIPAADDERGVCVKVGPCECNGEIVSCSQRICEPPPLCDPRDNSRCPVDDLCFIDDGEARCGDARVPARCETILDRTVARDGDVVSASALAFDVDGHLVPAGPQVITAACNAGVCAQVVTVEVRGVTCDAVTLPVHAAFTNGHRVVVADEDGPLVGALVRWFREGEVIGEGFSDFDGAAVVDPGVVEEVRVEKDGVEAHSVVDPPQDLLIVTRRLPGKVVAVEGTVDFSASHTKGDLHLAFSGLPLSRDVGRFSTTDVTGAPIDTAFDVNGITDGTQTLLQGAATAIGIGDTEVKARWQATTTARTGRLFVWSLGGQAQLSQVGPLLPAAPGFDVRFGRFLRDHSFSIVDAGAAVDVPAVVDVDGNGVSDALADLDAVEVTAQPNTLTFLDGAFDPNDAPFAASDSSAMSLLAVAGAVVPGAGVVPLGLAAFSSDDVAGAADNDNPLFVEFAPPHDGLEEDALETWLFAWSTPPVKDTDTLAFRRGDPAQDWAPVPEASVDESGVVVSEVSGFDVAHVRVVAADGRIWNVWTPRALALGEVANDLGVIDAASVSAVDLDDGAAFEVGVDGGASDVAAFTRVACVGGVCAP